MLKGIPSCISPMLLKALADMGHGDLVVIADDFYPSVSMARDGITVDADGIGAAAMLDAILQLMPLDTEYVEHPVLIMDVMEEKRAEGEILRRLHRPLQFLRQGKDRLCHHFHRGTPAVRLCDLTKRRYVSADEC